MILSIKVVNAIYAAIHALILGPSVFLQIESYVVIAKVGITGVERVTMIMN